MRSYDNLITISTRKSKNDKVIVLRNREGKRLSTSDNATAENIELYRISGEKAFKRLMVGYEINTRSSENIIFSEFIAKAMKQVNKSVNKDTAQDRQIKIEKHLIPYFGNMDIQKITPMKIEDWQYNFFKLRGANLTRRVKYLLKRILDRAIVHELITQNPVKVTENIREDREDNREIYTKDEVSTMVGSSTGWLSLFIHTMVSLGLRSGEIVVIQFSDINWKQRTIKIQRSIRNGFISLPKTGVSRTIDIPIELFNKLKEYHELRIKNENTIEWIFCNKKHDHYKDCSTITRRHFKPLLESLGIEYKSLYSLRHTFATLSLQGGQSVNYISKQLGHKDTRTTLEFYVKYLYHEKDLFNADEILTFSN